MILIKKYKQRQNWCLERDLNWVKLRGKGENFLRLKKIAYLLGNKKVCCYIRREETHIN